MNSNRTLKKVWNDEGDFYLFEEHCYGVHKSQDIMGFEDDIRKAWWNKIKTGDVVIDCGAHYGSYTLPALAQGATVHAFEVNEYIMKSLTNNITLNGWNDRCFLVDKALLDTSGRHIQISDEHLTALCENAIGEEPRFVCETITIDDYMKNKDRLDWVKIDVEGVEDRILNGALQTLKKYRPRLLVEIHDIVYNGSSINNTSKVQSFFTNNFPSAAADGPYYDPVRHGLVSHVMIDLDPDSRLNDKKTYDYGAVAQ